MPQVLIADDDPQYLAAFEAGMETLGHDVRLAMSSQDVSHALKEHVPDILFLDVLMPGGGAISILHGVAAKLPGLPVVIITGNAAVYDSPIVTRGLQYARLKMPKTASLEELGEVIDRLTTAA